MQENKKIVLLMIIFVTFTAILIGISFFAGSRYAVKNMQVLYISQAEILNIEKARIANNPASDKQLFFGKPEMAIKYIEQVQNQMSKNTRLVLLTDSKIYGRNVRSISKEVHEDIIKNLAQPAEAK